MIKHPYKNILDQLWMRGTSFLNSSTAILGGAMTWVSDHQLVAALSEAGGFGVLAGGALSPELLREEIRKTRALTENSFGVNLILFHPQLKELLEMCAEEKVSHVFLGGGVPSAEIISKIQETGAKAIGFASSLTIAKRLIKLGISALVVEGSEAGGHVGPVSTGVLAQEILPICCAEVPIFIAGGIGDGQAILSYLLMGAAGCQLGTRFACSVESRAHPRFKEAFLKAHARDAVLSVQLDPRFPVIPVRALSNRGMQNFMLLQKEVIEAYQAGTLSQKEAQMKIEFFWSGALRRAVLEGDIEEGSLMAGQSVGLVTKIEPCEAIIASLLTEMCEGVARVHQQLAVCKASKSPAA